MPRSERETRFNECRDTMIRSAAQAGYTHQEISVVLGESERIIRRVVRLTNLVIEVNKALIEERNQDQDSP